MGVALLIGLVNAVVRRSGWGSIRSSRRSPQGSLIQALITMATGDTPIQSLNLAGSFAKIGQTEFLGITLPVYYALIVALSRSGTCSSTQRTGRRLYATGSTLTLRGSPA
jgi:hypothetical protein